MNLIEESTSTILPTSTTRAPNTASALCSKDALTDQFGWTVQTVLAALAFTCLVCKIACYFIDLYVISINLFF
jgi:hypothetical protein